MTRLLRPLAIGNVTLPNNLVLSPMAGFTDLPFRVLCRRHGAGLVCSEMVSANAVQREVPDTLVKMQTLAEEQPMSIQVFGTDPDQVADAAKDVAARCQILGFNMGCPAFQIKRQGCGAALLDHPDLAEELVRSIKGASSKPLIAKLRAGNRDRMDVVAFGRRMERAGADALILHGRTAADGYSGRADWTLIRALKESVGIPVIGNGDVRDGPTAERALRESGCDGLALGRATLGNPRIFREITRYLGTGEALPPATPEERLGDFLEYARMASGLGLDRLHVVSQAHQFTRAIPRGKQLRTSLKGPLPLEDVVGLVQGHLTSLGDAATRAAHRANA